jgi:hypothetical protein
LGEREQKRGGGSDLNGAKTYEIGHQSYKTGALRNAITKTRDHPLFERGIRFLVAHGFVKKFVHVFFLLKIFPALRALDQMSVKRILFGRTQLAVEIGGKKFVNLFVDRWHKVK